MAKECPMSGDIYLDMHVVHYRKNGKPKAYTVEPVTVGGEDIDSIKWVLDKMRIALEKPVIWHGEKWPKEYKDK